MPLGCRPLLQEGLGVTNEELRQRVAELEAQVYGPPDPDDPEGWRGPPKGASREDLLALLRELEEELAGGAPPRPPPAPPPGGPSSKRRSGLRHPSDTADASRERLRTEAPAAVRRPGGGGG